MSTTPQLLATTRADRAEIKRQLAGLAANPRSRAECAAAIDEYARQQAAQQAAKLRHAVLTLAAGRDLAGAFTVRSVTAPTPLDVAAAVAAAIGETAFAQVLKAYLTEVPEGIPREQREALRVGLELKLRDIEVREEALVVLCELEGLDVLRRPDADPAVVLAVPNDEAAAPVAGDADGPANAAPPPTRRKRGAMPDASGWLTP